MKIIIEHNYEELSETVARIILAEMIHDRRVNIDLTDGSTPKGAYRIVADIISKNPDNYENVHYYNHDEMEGEEQLVRALLKQQVHTPFKVKESNIHSMDFNNPYQQVLDIENSGGLDLVVTGLGADGHFLANFPDATRFDEKVYVYDPKEYSWHDAYCKNLGLTEMSKLATLGYKMLSAVKRVVVIANGKGKAQAVKDILTKEISPAIPGTILRCHPNLILILDEEAASLLTEEDIRCVTK